MSGPSDGGTLSCPDGPRPESTPTAGGATPVHVGQTLGRKYRITRRLGSGAMGVVYEAFDIVLERLVALKVLPDDVAADPLAGESFLHEARAAARLNHPNVVTVYEADRDGAVYFLAMERMDGGTVLDLIRRAPPGWREATRIIADVCRGLAAAHTAGLIHRDIKPTNVMLAADGTAKLADFGLAVLAPGAGQSISVGGRVAGTPMYMSPEQYRGERVGPRSDVYSLGAAYFNLLTGRHPFLRSTASASETGDGPASVEDVRETAPDVPPACAELVKRMLAPDPADRPRTAAELLAALESLLNGHAASADRPSPREVSRRHWLLAAVGGVAACGVGLTVVFGRKGDAGGPQDIGQTHPPPATGAAVRTPRVLGEPDHTVPTPARPLCVALSPTNPDLMAYGCEDGTIGLVTVPGGPPQTTKKSAPIRHVAFSPAGDTWVAEYADGLRFFDARGEPMHDAETRSAPDGEVTSLAWPPGSRGVLLGVTANGYATGHLAFKLPKRTPPEWRFIGKSQGLPTVGAVAVSPDGMQIVSAHESGEVRVWNGPGVLGGTFSVLGRIGKHTPTVRAVFPPAGLVVAADGDLAVWDVARRERVKTLREGRPPITALASSPDGSLLAWAAGEDVVVYGLETGEVRHTVTPGGQVRAVAVSKDAKWLACDRPAGIGLWRLGQ